MKTLDLILCMTVGYYGNGYVESPCNYCSHNWESKFEPEANEIEVGDEVEAYSGRAIVFGTFTDTKGNKFCRYWYPSDDSFNKDKTENLKRTGRNFPQVAELIEAMKDDKMVCSTCKYNDGSDVSKCSDCCLSKEYNKWEPKEGAE